MSNKEKSPVDFSSPEEINKSLRKKEISIGVRGAAVLVSVACSVVSAKNMPVSSWREIISWHHGIATAGTIASFATGGAGAYQARRLYDEGKEIIDTVKAKLLPVKKGILFERVKRN